MGIYSPETQFSSADKRLLELMERLLLEKLDCGSDRNPNIDADFLVLSNEEARELAERLEELINSRQFLESSAFVEGLMKGEARNDALKDAYLSLRSQRTGRSRTMSSKLWADFLSRLGGERDRFWGSYVYRMSQDYFLKMEKRLLLAAGIHPRVVSIVLQLVASQSDEIEYLRDGQRRLKAGLIREAIANPLKKLRSPNAFIRDNQISTTRICAAITIITDLSVMFTTRDWTVTGTLSSMAGATAGVVISDRDPTHKA